MKAASVGRTGRSVVLLGTGGLSQGRAPFSMPAVTVSQRTEPGDRADTAVVVCRAGFRQRPDPGLLDLLAPGVRPGSGGSLDHYRRQPHGRKLETAVAVRQFLAALRQSCSENADLVAELFVPITGPGGRLRELSQALGCRTTSRCRPRWTDVFPFFGAGLLPARCWGWTSSSCWKEPRQ